MNLTKYEHACFTLEKDGSLLIVDPGRYTTDLGAPEHVVAIVVTHEHPDHFDPDALAALYDRNPESILIAHHTITEKMVDHTSRSVSPGDQLDLGPFNLKFVGGEHAAITPDMAPLANLGLIVDHTLYYPGDSFYVPEDRIETLLLPVAAPWCKISEVMAFFVAMQPKRAFPTHDAILSDQGKALVDHMLKTTAETAGSAYWRLSESVEI